MFAKKTPAKDVVELEESLGSLERAQHFGNSKLSLQRLVCVHELIDCAHEIGYEATDAHLMPLVRALAKDEEVLVRQTLVSHLGDLSGFFIQSKPETGGFQKVVDDVLPIIGELLTEKASEVRQGAADALTTVASHLRCGRDGDNEVLTVVIALSHSNDDEDARSTAVQLLNGLAETLGRDLCQRFVGIELSAFCEDLSPRVRKVTATSFAEVAKIVGDEYVLKRLHPAFKKLVNDSHWNVRKAAAESLVGFAMAQQVETREAHMVELMNQLLKDQNRFVRISALQQLGYFIASLEHNSRVPKNLLAQYVEIIEQTKGNPDTAEICYHCAYTFAAVTRTMGETAWTTLQAPFASLCRDTQLKARKAMAASIFIVAQTLGSDRTEWEVLPQFEWFLQDSAQEVRLAALRNMADVLRAVPKIALQRRLLRSLQTNLAKADSWRLRQMVAAQIGPICEALGVPSSAAKGSGEQSEVPAQAKDLTWTILLPLLLQLCGDAVAEVRDEAARATAKALRAAAPELFIDPSVGVDGSSGCSSGPRQPLPPPTAKLVHHLIREFARGRSFRNRQIYIRMCDSIIRESPPQVFAELLQRPLVKLATDPVKNVRLCWATALLPHLRKYGRLAKNPTLLAAAIEMSKRDPDGEVVRILGTVQLAELPAGWDPAAAQGVESDPDESDKGENWFVTEGGTGESSECSDVGVTDEETATAPEALSPNGEAGATGEQATGPAASPALQADNPQGDAATPAAPAAAATSATAASSSGGSSSSGTSGTGSTTTPARMSPKSAGAGVAPVQLLPPAPAPAPPPASSGSPQLSAAAAPRSPTMAPSHDPVEDSLVEQGEINRDLDVAFVDRRLFHEAEQSEEWRQEVQATLLLPPQDAEGLNEAAWSRLPLAQDSMLGSALRPISGSHGLRGSGNTQDGAVPAPRQPAPPPPAPVLTQPADGAESVASRGRPTPPVELVRTAEVPAAPASQPAPRVPEQISIAAAATPQREEEEKPLAAPSAAEGGYPPAAAAASTARGTEANGALAVPTAAEGGGRSPPAAAGTPTSTEAAEEPQASPSSATMAAETQEASTAVEDVSHPVMEATGAAAAPPAAERESPLAAEALSAPTSTEASSAEEDATPPAAEAKGTPVEPAAVEGGGPLTGEAPSAPTSVPTSTEASTAKGDSTAPAAEAKGAPVESAAVEGGGPLTGEAPSAPTSVPTSTEASTAKGDSTAPAAEANGAPVESAAAEGGGPLTGEAPSAPTSVPTSAEAQGAPVEPAAVESGSSLAAAAPTAPTSAAARAEAEGAAVEPASVGGESPLAAEALSPPTSAEVTKPPEG